MIFTEPEQRFTPHMGLLLGAGALGYAQASHSRLQMCLTRLNGQHWIYAPISVLSHILLVACWPSVAAISAAGHDCDAFATETVIQLILARSGCRSLRWDCCSWTCTPTPSLG